MPGLCCVMRRKSTIESDGNQPDRERVDVLGWVCKGEEDQESLSSLTSGLVLSPPFGLALSCLGWGDRRCCIRCN